MQEKWQRQRPQRPYHEHTVLVKGRTLKPPQHLVERVFERHGWHLTESIYTHLIRAIWSGDAEHVEVPAEDRPENARLAREHFRIEAFGEFYVFVYDAQGDVIVTVLHSGWLRFEDGEWRLNYKTKAKQRVFETRVDNKIRKLRGW